MLIDIENSTKQELITEYEKCELQWSKWSCDCFGYYMIAIHKKIVELGGFNKKANQNK